MTDSSRLDRVYKLGGVMPFRIETIDDLQAMQREFFRLIRRPLEGGRHMRPVEGLECLITASETLSNHERLELYAQQYWWRLLRVMRTDFPKTRMFLSHGVFADVVVEYLDMYPSKYPRLKRLGKEFASFLANCATLTPYQRSVSENIARIEWAALSVQQVCAPPPLTIQNVELSGEATKIQIQPFVALVELSRAVDGLFESDSEEGLSCELSNSELFEIDNVPTGGVTRDEGFNVCDYALAIYRQGGVIKVVRLNRMEADLYRLAKEPLELQSLIAEMISWCEDAQGVEAEEFRDVFARFARRGWLAQIGGETKCSDDIN